MCGSEVGVERRWILGSLFAGTGTWERNGSEAKEVLFLKLLFADDTAIVGMQEEMNGGMNAMKEVKGKMRRGVMIIRKSVWMFAWKRVRL